MYSPGSGSGSKLVQNPGPDPNYVYLDPQHCIKQSKDLKHRQKAKYKIKNVKTITFITNLNLLGQKTGLEVGLDHDLDLQLRPECKKSARKSQSRADIQGCDADPAILNGTGFWISRFKILREKIEIFRL